MAPTSCFIRFLGLGFSALTASFSMAESAVQKAEYTVEALAHCPGQASPTTDFILFDGSTNLLTGWNQASKKAEFSSLSYKPEAYSIDANGWVASPECAGEKIFSAILVKKLGSWQGSHINGIEPIFERANIRFEDIEAVVLELKLVAGKTHLPDRSAYHQLFAFAATAEQLDTVDTQQYNFGITLFGASFQDQGVATLNSQTLITLDPATQQDQWLRITLPVESMQTYLEKHYAPTAVALADHSAQQAMGLRINPETAAGKVVRHLNSQAWEAGEQPEMFKEMAIELRKVALVLNKQK